MTTLSRIGLALASVAVIAAFGSLAVTAQVNGNDNSINIMDDCLSSDPGFPGGCNLKPHQGDVSLRRVQRAATVAAHHSGEQRAHRTPVLAQRAVARHDAARQSDQGHQSGRQRAHVHRGGRVRWRPGGAAERRADACARVQPGADHRHRGRRFDDDRDRRTGPAQVPVLHPSVDAGDDPRRVNPSDAVARLARHQPGRDRGQSRVRRIGDRPVFSASSSTFHVTRPSFERGSSR